MISQKWAEPRLKSRKPELQTLANPSSPTKAELMRTLQKSRTSNPRTRFDPTLVHVQKETLCREVLSPPHSQQRIISTDNEGLCLTIIHTSYNSQNIWSSCMKEFLTEFSSGFYFNLTSVYLSSLKSLNFQKWGEKKSNFEIQLCEIILIWTSGGTGN